VTPRTLPLDRLISVVTALRSGEDFARSQGNFSLGSDLRHAQTILGVWLNVDIPVLVGEPIAQLASTTEVSS